LWHVPSGKSFKKVCNMDDEKINIKDIIAFIIALISTHLLPIILIGIIMILLSILIMLLR
jgi:hypothetical protein